MRKYNFESGARFGNFTVIELDVLRPSQWKCRCDCGSVRSVVATQLVTGKHKSCGCLQLKHGQTKRLNGVNGRAPHGSTYRSWQYAKTRCTNPNAKDYPYYGGRGIRICERWKHNFLAFLEDMGPRPEGSTLDRVNPDGNYELANCRWATRAEQSNNTRRVRWIDDHGERRSTAEVARKYGLSYWRAINVVRGGVKPITDLEHGLAAGILR